ncbi:MAG TPA: tripartite tricarboxylate transporter substrate-binding protein, partial [Propylenella sp.]|nr:tripartite tricarboxylate transporter substrate-binding protein [Propylenella sp.]
EALPDLATTAEAGLPDLNVSIWHGLYAPKGTPPEVVQKLNEALKAALKDPSVAERFAELGTTPVSEDLASPEAHRERLQSQTELWKPIFEKAGVQPQ